MRTDVALIRWTSREKMSATSLAQVSRRLCIRAYSGGSSAGVSPAAAAASVVSLFLTGSTITIFMTGGGSVFVTRAVTSRCFRLYCSGYFRLSSQADA